MLKHNMYLQNRFHQTICRHLYFHSGRYISSASSSLTFSSSSSKTDKTIFGQYMYLIKFIKDTTFSLRVIFSYIFTNMAKTSWFISVTQEKIIYGRFSFVDLFETYFSWGFNFADHTFNHKNVKLSPCEHFSL